VGWQNESIAFYFELLDLMLYILGLCVGQCSVAALSYTNRKQQAVFQEITYIINADLSTINHSMTKNRSFL